MRRILSCVIAFFLTFSMLKGCDELDESKESSTKGKAGVTMSLSDDGKINITRNRKSSSQKTEGTWSIFVYMCGSDLESENGMASMDMDEMMSAATGSDVRFVIQTGGAGAWQNENVDASKTQRFVIQDGEMELVDEQDMQNFGESQTLKDFLSWGIEKYNADNNAIVFWDHGGGSLSGVCFDENYDNDSLSLREIDSALADVSESMENTFTFIGFDTCLMSSIENANMLASYGNYMFASEETEPGYGWDYKAIGDYLGENSSIDVSSLGKCVADSFYESCAAVEQEAGATLAVIDLSKIDNVVQSFNEYAQELYESTQEQDTLANLVRKAKKVDNYGGNNKSEGYTNMVDLAGIVNAGSDISEKSKDVISAIEDAVLYCKNGEEHPEACGLSTYFPLQMQSSDELKQFSEVVISPYYLSFLDRTAYGVANAESDSEYDNSQVISIWDDNWSSEDETEDTDYWDSYCDNKVTGESPYITFESVPRLNENGSYGFKLSADGLQNAASVQGSVYMLSDDGKDIIQLGLTSDINMDWETGEVSDNFDGYWFSLPDGQNLAVYLVEECDGYDVLTSPVKINNKETNLRLVYDYKNEKVSVCGTWDGIDDNGMAAREVTPLKAGDKIKPIYYATSVEGDDEFTYEGKDYTYDGKNQISFDLLSDGEYFYGFSIDDIYGDYYLTDYVNFTIRDGEPYFG